MPALREGRGWPCWWFFELEGLKVGEERGFKIGFQVFRPLSEAGELQDVGVTNEIGEGLLWFLFPCSFDDGLLVGGETGALIKQGADLTTELSHGPVCLEAFIFIEGPLPGIIDGDEFDQLAP